MNNYNYTSLSNMLVLDIEAVREYKTFEQFCAERNLENWKKVAAKHYSDVLKSEEIPNDEQIYLVKAGLYAEYAKVVCIGLARATVDLTTKVVVSKKAYDLTNHDEKSLLMTFASQLEKAYEANPNTILCGHNILEYDVPFLVKRMIKYKIPVPSLLKNMIFGKPWEIKIIDTMRDWKMNTSKYMSMDTICEFLGIPSSKNGEVNGATLGDYYWNNSDQWDVENVRLDPIMMNIAKYCKNDCMNVIEICEYLSQV